jgi:hypothetical protein
MNYLLIIIIVLFIIVYFIPCGKKNSVIGRSTSVSPSAPAPQTTRPQFSRVPTIVENPKPSKKETAHSYLSQYYNFTTTPFTIKDLENIKGAYMVFDASDLIQRTPLFNFPKQYAKKSILLQDDVDNVGKIVSFLKSNGNNVGVLVDICSLQDALEDVHLLGLEKDVDYKYSRILPNGIEYLPSNNFTDLYIELVKVRLSQVKRCGFDFVQLGHFDPFSIFNYKNEDEYDINPDVTVDKCVEFIFEILEYCKQLELKISLSEFPRIFEDCCVKNLSQYVDYVSIYTLDPRTFIKPHKNYLTHFANKPIFLTSYLNDQVIPYFVYLTEWPIEGSIIYEAKQLFENNIQTPSSLVVGNRYIDWSFPPKKEWKVEITTIPNTMPPSLSPTLPLYPIPKLNPPN